VSFNLSRYDVSIWDVVSQKWVIPEGEFGVTVGKSSLDRGVVGSFCPSGKK
jgi:beta-glucosidase